MMGTGSHSRHGQRWEIPAQSVALMPWRFRVKGLVCPWVRVTSLLWPADASKESCPMTNPMVERVARALAEDRRFDWGSMPEKAMSAAANEREWFRRLARVAISAMREPTPEQMQAGHDAHFRPHVDWVSSAKDTYHAMIDAALKDQPDSAAP